MNKVYLMDCMEGMKGTPDKYYDLAVCDFEYGIGVDKMAFTKERNTSVKQKNGSRINPNRNKEVYHKTNWDKQPPPQEYFDEVCRVSKHQILFGIEYVNWVGVGSGRIKWNKGFSEGVSFKPYEMAYCSMIDYTFELDLLWAGMQQAKSIKEPMVAQGNKKLNEKRIHVCHKPILLYDLIFLHFAKRRMKILDTHVGGMSIIISAIKNGLTIKAYENDPITFNKGKKRIETYLMQGDMFNQPKIEFIS